MNVWYERGGRPRDVVILQGGWNWYVRCVCCVVVCCEFDRCRMYDTESVERIGLCCLCVCCVKFVLCERVV